LLEALETGRSRLGVRLKITHAQRDALVQDASGDSLDAVLCMIQAAWAQRQGAPAWGLPAQVDPLEGWILTA
jgi:predicted RNase H-like nuclease